MQLIKLGGNKMNSQVKAYVVFKCLKCKQYTYAKTTQKSKKCPRCNANYKTIIILNNLPKFDGILVDGLINASQTVKRLQFEISIFKTQSFNSLTSSISLENRITKSNNILSTKTLQVKKLEEDPLYEYTLKKQEIDEWFIKLINFLKCIQVQEKIDENIGFPEYVLDISITELGIPNNLKTQLIQKFKKSQNVIKLNNGNYFVI